jgi:putative nucleotidyltransferase with HDIG domain
MLQENILMAAGKALGGNKTAKFQMSETLKALLRVLLLLVSACLPYYFRLILGIEVDLADFLYAPAILAVLWWPTEGTLVALSISLLLLLPHLFAEPAIPMLHDLQRSLTLFAITLVTSVLSRQGKGAEQEIRQRSQELSALNTIAFKASQSLDLDEILRVAFDKVLETMGAGAGGIYLLDERARRLTAKFYRGVSPDFVEETIRWDESLATRVLRAGQAIVVEDISKEPSLARVAANGEGLRSYISVPLKSNGRILGVMDVITRQPRQIASRDKELLTSIGNQIGVAMDKARLFEELQESFVGIIAALATTIDAKDPYTRGHSERVAQYASGIARELGLEPCEVKTIHYAGLLHDIGKIGISERTLLKPDALDTEEWDVMKAHPIIGAMILEPIPHIQEIVPLVYHHHERYDGMGYPDGLAGEEIPLGARILAVADAFEAMTSRRPYRPALSHAQAIALLQDGIGKQWDAEVVEALLRSLKSEMLRCGIEGFPIEPLKIEEFQRSVRHLTSRKATVDHASREDLIS